MKGIVLAALAIGLPYQVDSTLFAPEPRIAICGTPTSHQIKHPQNQLPLGRPGGSILGGPWQNDVRYYPGGLPLGYPGLGG